MFLVDSHCHLHLLDLEKDSHDLNQVIKRAQDNGVQHILNVCVSISEFKSMLKIVQPFPFVSTSLGLHPNEQDEDVDLDTLLKLGEDNKVVAIGETGLDYFRSTGVMTWQQNRFRMHIEAAKLLKKQLIIHTRQAKEDTIRIMREEKADIISGVMHCFTEDWAMAKQALDLNFYISFSGIVTFKNAPLIQDVAKRMPLDRMLIETDAPYLAPNPHRGKQNEPAFVRYTAEFIAALRGERLENIANATTENFFKLFTRAARNV